jgi:hypothetical protein
VARSWSSRPRRGSQPPAEDGSVRGSALPSVDGVQGVPRPVSPGAAVDIPSEGPPAGAPGVVRSISAGRLAGRSDSSGGSGGWPGSADSGASRSGAVHDPVELPMRRPRSCAATGAPVSRLTLDKSSVPAGPRGASVPCLKRRGHGGSGGGTASGSVDPSSSAAPFCSPAEEASGGGHAIGSAGSLQDTSSIAEPGLSEGGGSGMPAAAAVSASPPGSSGADRLGCVVPERPRAAPSGPASLSGPVPSRGGAPTGSGGAAPAPERVGLVSACPWVASGWLTVEAGAALFGSPPSPPPALGTS